MYLIFIGSSFFSCIFLLTLIQAGFIIVAVFTSFRYYPRILLKFILTIENLAFFFQIPIYYVTFLLNFFCFRLFYNLQIDYIFLASCAVYLPPKLLKLSRYGCLNLHPSILPRLMGSNPLNYVVFLKDSVFGVTTLFISSDIDSGPIMSCIFDSNKLYMNYFFSHIYFSLFSTLYIVKHLIYFSYGCIYITILVKKNNYNIITRKLLFSCY